MEKVMKIHPADNVWVAKRRIDAGESIDLNGTSVATAVAIGLGHKIAATNILKGEKVIKFGIPIGSATEDIPLGGHVHLHNLKSDYLPTYTLHDEFIRH
jgi:hypothetical protein